VTEKEGRVFLTTQAGKKFEVSGVPVVQYNGQNGLLDIAVAADFNKTRSIYLSFVELGREGSGLALARAPIAERQWESPDCTISIVATSSALETHSPIMS
jgi:glucose/arabinose dehydrogenase